MLMQSITHDTAQIVIIRW